MFMADLFHHLRRPNMFPMKGFILLLYIKVVCREASKKIHLY